MKQFKQFLVENGYRYSRQRETVAHEFLQIPQHIRVDEFFLRIQRVDSKIGIATVYRTLSLLKECGLAQRRDFGAGDVSYERSPKEHHDHLICTLCGTVVEFVNREIEKLQDKEARKHGFDVVSHKMELYGRCPACIQKKPAMS